MRVRLRWIGVGLVGVVILLMWGSLALAEALPGERYSISIGAFFAIAVVSFFGFLLYSRELREPAGVFDDADVRLAITCSFVTLYFALITFSLFAQGEPSGFARSLVDDLLTLTGIVVGFYFATTGALEYARIRERRGRREEPPPSESGRTEIYEAPRPPSAQTRVRHGGQ